MAQHHFGDLKVGDHSVTHRADCYDIGRSAAQHAFGFVAKSQRAVVILVDRDHRRLAQDDA
jgi:molybdopterin synthase catalytic subunit